MKLMKKIMHFMVLSCRKATRLIEKKHAHGLKPLESIQLKVHTSMCSACSAFEKQSKILDEAIEEITREEKSKEVNISEDAKKHIISNIDKKV